MTETKVLQFRPASLMASMVKEPKLGLPSLFQNGPGGRPLDLEVVSVSCPAHGLPSVE